MAAWWEVFVHFSFDSDGRNVKDMTLITIYI
jgi:hypothetical protein